MTAKLTEMSAPLQPADPRFLSVTHRQVRRARKVNRLWKRLHGWLRFTAETTVVKPTGALPPEWLRTRVAGTPNADWFDSSGRQSVDDYRLALSRIGRRIEDFDRVLDFGCGCGRVLRWLGDLPPTTSVHGCDIDPEAVEWLRSDLPHFAVLRNEPLPSLEYRSASFDLVLCHSVFTHLDEAYQDAWLQELCRVTVDDAILLISFMGDHAFAKRVHEEASLAATPELLRAERNREGLLFLPGDDVGLPDFYQTTYHANWYVFEHWSRYFNVLAHVERGALNYQDLLVLKRPRRTKQSG